MGIRASTQLLKNTTPTLQLFAYFAMSQWLKKLFFPPSLNVQDIFHAASTLFEPAGLLRVNAILL